MPAASSMQIAGAMGTAVSLSVMNLLLLRERDGVQGSRPR